MLNGRLALADVHDVEAFVIATLHRSGLVLTADERDELTADGLEIMCVLHRDYRPGAGTFSGYATSLLRGRLLDRHHQHHRGEHVKTRRDGRAVWEYRPAIQSLNQALEHPGFDESRVTRVAGFQRPAALRDTASDVAPPRPRPGVST